MSFKIAIIISFFDIGQHMKAAFKVLFANSVENNYQVNYVTVTMQ